MRVGIPKGSGSARRPVEWTAPRVRPQRVRATGPARAVILAGGPDTTTFEPARGYSRLAFPMADGRSLLSHLLGALHERGVADVAVVGSAQTGGRSAVFDLVARYDGEAPRVAVFVDDGLCGSAGALRLLRDFIVGERFVLVGSDRWLDGLDLDAICAAHHGSGAAATVVVEDVPVSRSGLEELSVAEDGRLESLRVLHRSRRSFVAPTGVYVFEPEVLDLVEPEGYQDLKEQLLPKLTAAGQRVQTHRLAQPLARIDDIDGYRTVNRNLLHRMVEAEAGATTDVIGGVVMGQRSTVATSAYILGPVMIGDDCTIEDGAQIIGPTVICDGTVVSARALVRESFVWRGCRLGPRSRVVHSVITDASTIEEGRLVENTVVVGDGCPDDRAPRAGRRRATPRPTRLGRRAYQGGKRGLDVACSALALAVLSPVMLLVAAAIKLDSPGPVFFRQKRCGRDGRDFTMLKFRSMCVDAEQRKGELAAKNEARGPMFKIKADPRTTRVGRFLRRTSLDELPQLYNVLKGDMSLVGPRPLAMDEMDWAPKWRDLRLQVKPGVTGLWQVHARNEEGFERWIDHDIRYVLDQSFLLDVRILIKTALSVMR